jgi:ABC-type polysaccharide/polyol phosphate export permease
VVPTAAAFAFPVLLILQVAFTCGIAWILASLTVLFRDVRHLIEIAISVLFWATPVVYRLSDVPARFRPVIAHLPLAPFIVGYQTIFVDGAVPSADIWITAALYAAGALFIGTRVFFRIEPRLAELM